MTWPLRICSSVCLALPLAAATVGGTVHLADSHHPDVRKNNDYSGVVVWLDPLNGQAMVPHASTVRMIQKNKKFTPHVLAIQVGTTVDFPNFDPIFHNAFSNFSGQPFDVGLYAPGTSQKVQFRREGFVRVFCNIHPTMSAVIVVLKTRYHAVTTPGGAYEIEGVHPGEYRLRVFHERATEETLRALERKVTVENGAVALAPISISESGFLQIPHKNKYGKEYPPVIEDVPIYPAGRKQ